MTSLLPSTGQFQKPLSGISMFDWPEANHTSPMSTRLRMTFSPPCSSMTMVCSSFEAAGVAMLSSHWPSLSARVVNLSPVQSTVTVMSHFGAACPQRRACVFCCRTMSSPMMSGSTIFACTGLTLMARSAQTAPMNFVIIFIFLFLITLISLISLISLKTLPHALTPTRSPSSSDTSHGKP